MGDDIEIPAILAVDVGGTKAAIALVDRDGNVQAHDRVAMMRAGCVPGPQAVARRVADFLARCARQGLSRPVAVGISVAAAIDPAARRVLYAPNLPGWEGIPLGDVMERQLGGLPAVLVYDGHAAVLGEWAYGAARGCANVAMVVLGTGVGGGILAGGRLVEGADGLAGVVGWVPVLSQGRLVPLESAVSGPALARRGTQALGRTVDASELLAAARAEVSQAKQVVAAVLEELAVAVTALTSLLNPQLVLIGGGLGEALAPHLPEVEAHVRARAQPSAARRVAVRSAKLGASAGLLGAAWRAGVMAWGPRPRDDGSIDVRWRT